MKRTSTVACLLVGIIATFAMTAEAAPPFSFAKPAEHKLNWQSNLQTAHKVATEQNKPMLLVFGADWCHYCKKLEKETLSSQQISSYVNQSFVAVHLDADKDKKVAEILKVSSLPCTIVLSPNADLLGRIEGYFTPAPYYKKLATAREKLQIVQRTSVSN